MALRNLRKVLSTTKLLPKIQFSSKFCVKYININVLSQLNVTTSLKCKYEKCCFLFIVVVSHFFWFSESKYVKCFTLNLLNYSKYVSVSFKFFFVFFVTVALNFEESQERMLIFVASMPEMAKIN